MTVIKNPLRAGWPARKHLYASLLSLTLLSLALLTLWIGHWLPASLPEKIEVREVALMSPPPPPPPPPQQPIVEAPLRVQIQGTGASIPKVEAQQKIEPIKPDIPAVELRQSQWQSLDIDWNTLDINQLDGLPALMTPLRMRFPRSLSRQGIKRALVKLDVVIDEKGQVTLVSIVENPHVELLPEIQRLVRNSRFTPPKKDNQAVRARFIWPVEIKS